MAKTDAVRLRSPGPKCRRSPPISVPATAFSACCRHRACRPLRAAQAMACDRLRRHAPNQRSRTAPASRCRRAHSGWIIQVGALESESEARQRIDAARSQARGLLDKADPFTEPVVAKGNQKAVPRPLCRPRARPGRGGMPDAEARRYFLHHRSQLIASSELKSQSRRQAPALLRLAHSLRRRSTFRAKAPSPVRANFSSRIYG